MHGIQVINSKIFKEHYNFIQYHLSCFDLHIDSSLIATIMIDLYVIKILLSLDENGEATLCLYLLTAFRYNLRCK